MADQCPITTHVLDIMSGRPAAGVTVSLERRSVQGVWSELGRGTTNEDGRLVKLLEGSSLSVGTYRITFGTAEYFQAAGIEPFYPEVSIVFDVRRQDEHYHVPLLLSPFGYSTYRGS